VPRPQVAGSNSAHDARTARTSAVEPGSSVGRVIALLVTIRDASLTPAIGVRASSMSVSTRSSSTARSISRPCTVR
jgi:hypothetical protein